MANELTTVFSFDDREASRRIDATERKLISLDARLNNLGGNLNIGKTVSDNFISASRAVDTFSNKINAVGKQQISIGKNDATLNAAISDIKRLEAERASITRQSSLLIRNVRKEETKALNDEVKAQTRNFKRELSEIERSLKQPTASGNGGLFGAIIGGNLVARGISLLTSEFIAGGKSILDYSSNLQQAQVGLTTITGSAETAAKHLKDLQDFAKSTPFEFSDLVTASQKLQGVGFSAEKVIPVLRDVGASLAASGRISELPFAIKALGDIQAKGKLAGQEIIQLANAGVPAIKILSGALNKTNAEVLALSENGQISSKVFLEALHRYSESNFGGALEAQSKTFQGAISNIKDALGQTSEVAFRPLFQKVSEIAGELSAAVGREDKNLQDVGGIIARSVIIGFKDVIKEELTDEVNQIRKNLAENKPSGISTPQGFGASLLGEGNSLPELFRAARRLSSISSDNDLTVDDIPALKSLNFFGKFDDLIKQLEADKQLTADKLIEAITFRSNDFSKLDGKGKPLKIDTPTSNKELFRQLEAQTKFNLSAVDTYLDYSKTQIATDSSTNVLQKITSTLEIEQLAIKEKIRLQKKFAEDQLKNLTPEERRGEKGATLALSTVDTVNKLETQSEILRLNAQKQIEDFRKSISDLGNDIISLSSAQNPLAKQFYEVETATSRAEKKFGQFGATVVKQIADIERANLNKAIGLEKFQNNLDALKFRQEAFKLQNTPDRLLADSQRNLERVNQTADFTASGNSLDRQIQESAFYQRLFNPNNPKSFNEFNRRGVNDDFSDVGVQIRNAVKDIADLSRISLGGSGAIGQGIIADKILGLLPSRDELLRRLSNPRTRDEAQFLLAAQTDALIKKRNAEREKFSNFLEDQQLSQLNKIFAKDQISLINQNRSLTDGEKATRRLAVTDALGNDLDNELKRGRVKDFIRSAEEKDNLAKEAMKIANDTKLAVEGIVKLLSEKGIKLDKDSQSALSATVRVIDETKGGVESQLQPAPNSNDQIVNSTFFRDAGF